MTILFWFVIFLGVAGITAYRRFNLTQTTASFLAFFVVFSFFSPFAFFIKLLCWAIFLAPAIIINVPSFRQELITRNIFMLFKKQMPSMSPTEKIALDAGDIWWEAELISGRPQWNKLLKFPKPTLSEEEHAFLNGPVNELCAMINDWEITHDDFDMPPQMWTFIKEQGFFALIIPKKYGGKEFSALAHAEILSKIAGRSITVASSISVPNSLGPAELLLHYGTQEQKDHYLPRLAKGEDVPCFALTSPEAGSDASAIPDSGIVCKQIVNNQEILGIKLNFDKRYITLAPVATVIGLAFKLYDPEHLLGEQEDYGITCALIPRNTPGITVGDRHYPLDCAFQNGPIVGKNVFIPLDWIIGGPKMAGKGWQMLVECLSAGRAISLPSVTSGGAKLAAIATGAYARIRKQFNHPIGFFEGIEAVLARIGSNVYMCEATRKMTTGGIDMGIKPAVASAIVKYHVTERSRQVSIDAMDIHGGKGICMGPRNYLGRGYQAAPIGITVEGANILTRNMIIFGQGSIRCHPFLLKEMTAAQNNQLEAFDESFWCHIGYFCSNIVRTFVLSITNAKFTRVPGNGDIRRFYQQLTRYSSALALMTDIALLVLGGKLKRREKLSARLGDVLSMLYLCSATLKRYQDDGAHKEDLPFVERAIKDALYVCQESLNDIIRNFPDRGIAICLRALVFPLGLPFKPPKDQLDHEVAQLMLYPNDTRSRLGEGLYLADVANNPVGHMELTLKKVIAAEPIEKRVREAIKNKIITEISVEDQIYSAISNQIITEIEGNLVLDAYHARSEVIAVDQFKPEDLVRKNR